MLQSTFSINIKLIVSPHQVRWSYIINFYDKKLITSRYQCLFPHLINTLGVQLQLNKVVFLFDKVLTQILLIFMISTLSVVEIWSANVTLLESFFAFEMFKKNVKYLPRGWGWLRRPFSSPWRSSTLPKPPTAKGTNAQVTIIYNLWLFSQTKR